MNVSEIQYKRMRNNYRNGKVAKYILEDTVLAIVHALGLILENCY